MLFALSTIGDWNVDDSPNRAARAASATGIFQAWRRWDMTTQQMSGYGAVDVDAGGAAVVFLEGESSWISNAPWWLISVGFHLVLILLAGLIMIEKMVPLEANEVSITISNSPVQKAFEIDRTPDVVGRKGLITPYSEFLTQLGDAEKAKKATIAQFKGKTIAAYYPHREALIRAILEQGGLTMDDIFKLEFPDDEKAALAMVGGTGDLYLGGLPGELNLLMNHPDKFINVGGHEIMGAAGLWYSQIGSSKDWLAKNEDATLKLTAMMYRFNRYVK